MTDLFGTIDRLREPERPRFVRFGSGNVHVLAGYVEVGNGDLFLGASYAREVALCGERGPAGAMSIVPDAVDGICVSCFMLWPHDSDRLFEEAVSHEGVH